MNDKRIEFVFVCCLRNGSTIETKLENERKTNHKGNSTVFKRLRDDHEGIRELVNGNVLWKDERLKGSGQSSINNQIQQEI